MDKDQIILILLVAMALVLIIEIIYILARKKRRKAEMSVLRKSSEPVETMADKAHNMIATTENISSSLARQGIDTSEADSILDMANRDRAQKNYIAAIEQAESAKLVLLRLKREHDARAKAVPARADADANRRPVERVAFESDDMAREARPADTLPANYVQAKFMLTTTKDILDKRGITSGQAYDFYSDAVSAYERGDYTKALSLSIKSEKLLGSGALTLIGEEKPHHDSEEVIEVLVCPGCESEVSEDDAFCRECGQNLAGLGECPGCGTEVESSDKFCRKCGAKQK